MHEIPPKLRIKLGKIFEASASGSFAIASLVAIVLTYFGGLGYGLW